MAMLQVSPTLTVEKLQETIPQLLSRMHIECLIHGNVNKRKALELVDIVESNLKSKINITALLPRQLLLNREFQLEDNCNFLYGVQNDTHKSSCVELYYQCGLQTKESNMLLELFAQIIQESCFNNLRTKEQLGYIVFSGIRRANSVQGLRIIVQSTRHPAYLDQRIEAFLANVLENLENLSDEEFEKHKEALAVHRLEKPKQLSTLSNQFWVEITAQQYHFNRAEVEVAYLRTLNKDDIINFYKSMIAIGSPLRRKLAVHILSTAEGGAGIEEDNGIKPISSDADVIQDITIFKSCHGLYPLVQPYINIPRKGKKCKL